MHHTCVVFLLLFQGPTLLSLWSAILPMHSLLPLIVFDYLITCFAACPSHIDDVHTRLFNQHMAFSCCPCVAFHGARLLLLILIVFPCMTWLGWRSSWISTLYWLTTILDSTVCLNDYPLWTLPWLVLDYASRYFQWASYRRCWGCSRTRRWLGKSARESSHQGGFNLIPPIPPSHSLCLLQPPGQPDRKTVLHTAISSVCQP